MGAQSFLDQLLKTGLQALDQAGSTVQAKAGPDWQKYATGAAAGGALALLLGSRRGRQVSGSLLRLGSVAALGALAYKTWQNHQASQTAGGTAAPPAPATPPALSAPQLETQARVLLQAMIAAAKADGQVDERERGLLDGELQRLQADDATRAWVTAELARPLDAAALAAACTSPELAASAYLASVLVAADTTPAERAWLDQLARALQLDPALQAQLEARAAAA